jgi:multiple sugar transport system ATP-binding protein
MDEPLSNLDAKLRVQMRAEISELQRSLGVTTIYVTHDQVEAMTMGDRVAVMRKGLLQQVDDPQVLYDRPLNLFVGGFIGSPAMNMLDATLERENGQLVAVAASQRVPLSEETLSVRPGLARFEGRRVVLGIRPEDLDDASLADEGLPHLHGTVRLREALGAEVMVHLEIDAQAAETDETRELARDRGEETHHDSSRAVVVGRFSPRTRVREGEQVEAAVETRALHFFDPETGLGIYDGSDQETRQKGAQQ